MSLPVLAITVATLRVVPRIFRRHTWATLAAFACSFPFEYRDSLAQLAGEEGTFGEILENWLATMASLAIQLPLTLIAIREAATHQIASLDLRWPPSEATLRYAACSALVLTASMLIGKIDGASGATVLARFALQLLLGWFVLRSTLAFTALALGRHDLGFALSIRWLSGQTLRLFGILALPVAAIWLPAAVVGCLAISLLNIGDARITAAALVTVQFVINLTIVIAGAHIYRSVEGGSL